MNALSLKPDVFLLVMLAGSLGVNVYQGVTLRNHSGHAPGAGEIKTLPKGTALPVLEGASIDGLPIEVRRDALSTGDTRDLAVYVFSSSCSWCEKNLNNIRTLAQSKFSEYRFIGVSTGPSEALREYCRSNAINFEVMEAVPDSLQKAYDMGGTPQLIVVSPDGRLKRVFKGALSGEQKSEAEAFFGTTLPGLDSPPRTPAKAGLAGRLCVDPWGMSFDPGFEWPIAGLMHRCTSSGWVRVGVS